MAVGEVLASQSVKSLPEAYVEVAWDQATTLTGEPVASGENCVERMVAEAGQMPAPDAHADIAEAFGANNRRLGRLARAILGHTQDAEDVVGEVFANLVEHNGVRDQEKLVAYLTQSVVYGARSVLRRRAVAEKSKALLRFSAPWDNPAEDGLLGFERTEVRSLLGKLTERQREAIVLRYYGDLNESQIASVMGISRGSVKTHTARGMATLRGAIHLIAPEVD